MSRSFLTLCQDVTSETNIAGRGPATVVNQSGKLAEIVRAVAAADLHVQSRYTNWKFMWREFAETLIVGQSAVPNMPSTVKQWDRESLWLDYGTITAQQVPVVPTWKEYRNEVGFGTKTNSKPQMAGVKPDNSIVLDPPPAIAHAFTAEYWIKPVRMAANDDVSPIPEEYERIIIARAKLIIAATYGGQMIVGDASAEYTMTWTDLKSDQLPGQHYQQLSEHEPIVVVPR